MQVISPTNPQFAHMHFVTCLLSLS